LYHFHLSSCHSLLGCTSSFALVCYIRCSYLHVFHNLPSNMSCIPVMYTTTDFNRNYYTSLSFLQGRYIGTGLSWGLKSSVRLQGRKLASLYSSLSGEAITCQRSPLGAVLPLDPSFLSLFCHIVQQCWQCAGQAVVPVNAAVLNRYLNL
jgi:hypothetical protein